MAMDRVCPILRDRASGIPISKPRGAWLLSLALSLDQMAVEVASPYPLRIHTGTHAHMPGLPSSALWEIAAETGSESLETSAHRGADTLSSHLP